MRRRGAAIAAAVAAIALARGARADDAATPAPAPEPPPPPPPVKPDQASGIARPAETPTSHHLRWIPRVVLFVPRWAIWAAAQPIRLAAWSWEHYQLRERFK